MMTMQINSRLTGLTIDLPFNPMQLFLGLSFLLFAVRIIEPSLPDNWAEALGCIECLRIYPASHHFT
jgi:hypothetical protein